MNKFLAAYLKLEEAVAIVGDDDDGNTDLIRAAMDSLWYEMDSDSHRFLDARTINEVIAVKWAGRAMGHGVLATHPRDPLMRDQLARHIQSAINEAVENLRLKYDTWFATLATDDVDNEYRKRAARAFFDILDKGKKVESCDAK